MNPTLSNITTDVTKALKSGVDDIKDRVFPLVANQGTALPFIVYERESLSVVKTKDGITTITPTFTIKIVSSTYFSGLDIADKTIDSIMSMESSSGYRYDPEIISANEDYVEDTFIQTITFSL